MRALILSLRLALFVAALGGGGLLAKAAAAAYLADAQRREAEAALDWGRLEAALAALERAAALTPGDAKLYREKARVEAMMARFRPGHESDGAIAAYRRAAELNPLEAGAHADLGWLYADLGRYAEADAAFGNALAIDPHNAYFLVSVARLRELEGRRAEATALYERAFAIKPERDLRRRLRELERG